MQGRPEVFSDTHIDIDIGLAMPTAQMPRAGINTDPSFPRKRRGKVGPGMLYRPIGCG